MTRDRRMTERQRRMTYLRRRPHRPRQAPGPVSYLQEKKKQVLVTSQTPHAHHTPTPRPQRHASAPRYAEALERARVKAVTTPRPMIDLLPLRLLFGCADAAESITDRQPNKRTVNVTVTKSNKAVTVTKQYQNNKVITKNNIE